MKFKGCIKCEYRDASVATCFDICGKPIDILKCVEDYFNNSDYPEDLEMDLCNIVER